MLERLSIRWGHLSSLIESGSYEEENTDTQEMLEDLLIRMLTREYIDVNIVLLFLSQRKWLVSFCMFQGAFRNWLSQHSDLFPLSTVNSGHLYFPLGVWKMIKYKLVDKIILIGSKTHRSWSQLSFPIVLFLTNIYN